MTGAGTEGAPRLFTGLALSEEASGYVLGVIETMSGAVQGVKWVPPENLHVTLKFLGNCDWALVDRIADSMREASGLLPLPLAVGGVGGFPSSASARVLWVGAEDVEEKLHKVYNILDRAARSCGFPGEKRGYRPHITVGRARKGPARIPESLALSMDRRVLMEVADIILYRSVLGRTGAQYSVLKRIGPAGEA